jgi:V/A-type H+-transporting ATPase subunit D
MTSLRRVPPGRAGRLWLIDRLRSGRLAASLLDRKVRILRAEQQRLRQVAEQARGTWLDRARAADQWGLRSALVGGERELRLSAPVAAAEATIEWGSIMGTRYPTGATVRAPQPSDVDSGGSAATLEAGMAYGRAVEAAAAYAVARAASRIVDAEVDATRRRLRAISERWLPRLEAALTAVTRELDEAEREEAFRLRWAREADEGRAS